jgi:hypothetical protein
MPWVIGSDRANRTHFVTLVSRASSRRRRGLGGTLQHPPDGRGSKMQPRPAQQISDPYLAHGGEQGLELLNELADEVGEAIDGL